MTATAYSCCLSRSTLLLLLAGLGFSGLPLQAQMSYTEWDGGGGNANLSTGTNWQGNVAPPDDGSANVVFSDQFFGAGHSDLTPNLDYNWDFNTLAFAGGSSFTLGSTSNRGLSIGSGITQDSTAAQTIAVPTFLTDDQAWVFGANTGVLNFTSTSASGQIITQGHTLTLQAVDVGTLNGAISGAGAVVADSAGTVVLTGNNTYTGNTTLARGTLNAGSVGALGNGSAGGTIIFAGGTLQYSAANQTDYSSRFSRAANQAYNIDTNGRAVVFSTALTSSGGSLTKLGAGTLLLFVDNTYTGGTTLAGGTLSLNTSGALGSTGTISFIGGTLEYNSGITTDYSARFSQAANQAYSVSLLVPAVTFATALTSSGGSLSVGGDGTLTLTANNTYTGVTTISGTTYQYGNATLGTTLQIGNGGTTGTLGTGSVTDNGSLAFDRSDSVSVANAIGGSGSLTQLGTGTLTLTGNNTYTGSTTVSGGTLILGSGGGLGATNITVGAGAAFQIARNGTLTDGNTALTVDGSSASPATATLGGTATLSRGTVTVGDAGVGTLTQNSGTLNVNAVDKLMVGNRSGSSGTYTLDGASSRLNVGTADVGNGGAGVFNQSGGRFTVSGNLELGYAATGSGTYTLDGSTSRLSAGTIDVGYDGTGTFQQELGTVSASSLNLGVRTGSTGTYTLGGSSSSLSADSVTIGAAGSGTFNQSAGTFTTGGGTLTIGGSAGGSGYDGSTAGGTYNLSGGTLTTGTTIVGAGGFINTFTQTGGLHTTGMLDIETGGFLGQYNLNGGVLSVGSVAGGTAQSGAAGYFTFDGGTLQARGNSTTFFQNMFAATFEENGGTIDTNGFNVTVAQSFFLDVNSAGSGPTKVGSGTLTLSGNNAYRGATTVSAGTLQAGSGTAFGYGSAVTLANADGVTLDLNGYSPPIGALSGGGASGGNVTLGGGTLHLVGSSFVTSPAAFAGVISGAGGLYLEGNSVLTLSGTNTFTGGITVAAGTLTALNNGNALSSGAISINGRGVVELSNTTATAYNQEGATTFSGAGTLRKTGTGTIALGGSGTITLALSAGGQIDVEAGTLVGSSSYQADYSNNQAGLNIAAGATFNGVEADVRVNGLTGGGTLLGGYYETTNGTHVGSLTVGVAGGGGTFSGTIANNAANSGVLSLTKVGAGTQVLSGNNTYTGGTTFVGGALQAGSAGALGSNGTLLFDGGTLQYSAGNQTDYSPRFAVAANQAYNIDTNGQNVTFATQLTSPGGLNKYGAGTLVLTGNNAFTGGTTLARGTLNAGSAGALGSTGTITFAGGTLQYSAANQTDYSARFSQAANQAYNIDTNGQNVTFATALTSSGGTLTKLGAGTLSLVGNDTFSTGPTVSGGTLAVNAGNSVFSSNNLTVATGGAFDLGGSVTVAGTVTVDTGGTFTLDGASSSLSMYTGIVGKTGSATFTQNGGTVTTNGGDLFLGYRGGSSGTYNLNGGTLNTLLVADGLGNALRTATFHFNGGTLQAVRDLPNFFQNLALADVQAGGANVDTNGFNVTVAQPLLTGVTTGTDGGLTKLGTGTLTLTGNNTYTGPTNVNAGTLLVNGTHTGPGTVTVQNSGSTLGGTGTLAAAVNVTTGTLAPGSNTGAAGSAANVGTLTVGALTLSPTAAAVFDLAGGTAYDRLAATGSIALGGATLTLNVPADSGTFTTGQVLDLFHANGILSGTFGNLSNGGTYSEGGDTFLATYTPTDFTLTVIAVPEPATWTGGALLFGAAALGLRRRALRQWDDAR